MAQANCPKCEGTGWKIVEGDREIRPGDQRVSEAAVRQAEADGVNGFAVGPANGSTNKERSRLSRVAVPCECTSADKSSRVLARARLPERYQRCDFGRYETGPYNRKVHGAKAEAWNRSLVQAKIRVQGFTKNFPVATERGLLLMGPFGVGKTHLAVAALEEIVLRGHSGLFYEYRDLLQEIKHSFNPESNSTEMSVLEPVLKTELLVLDDLGAEKASDWARDIVGYILTTRYNENRITLMTTNRHDNAPAPSGVELSPTRSSDTVLNAPSDSQRYARVSTEETLAERIGARIRSRLYEMCDTVEICAPDYREQILAGSSA